MTRKERILAALNAMGVGYCSREACEEDIMGVGITWGQILDIPTHLIEDMYRHYKGEK